MTPLFQFSGGAQGREVLTISSSEPRPTGKSPNRQTREEGHKRSVVVSTEEANAPSSFKKFTAEGAGRRTNLFVTTQTGAWGPYLQAGGLPRASREGTPVLDTKSTAGSAGLV